MLEMIDIGIDNAIAYRIGGKITEEEMEQILSLCREKINNGEKLIIYQEVVSIGGAEFDAILTKLRFLMDVGLSHFSRIAVLTQKKWLSNIIDLEDKLFKNIKMKGFLIEEKEKAIAFLKQQ
jgi:hypothetical protein